jgi:hypothetical protein
VYSNHKGYSINFLHAVRIRGKKIHFGGCNLFLRKYLKTKKYMEDNSKMVLMETGYEMG